MSLLFADIFEAIRTLRACKGTTEKCIMKYVEERVGGCLGVAHTLKTIRTLHKLVEDGVLCKKGKRYMFPAKKAKRKQNECEEEEEEDECEEEEEDGDCCESEEECESEDEDDCDDECDDDEDDEDDEDDDYDSECDEEEEFDSEKEEKEIKTLKTRSSKGVKSVISKAINNNKPMLGGRPNRKNSGEGPICEKRNDHMNNCLNRKSNGKSNEKYNVKSSNRCLGKAAAQKRGNANNENEGKKTKIKPECDPHKRSTSKKESGSEDLNKKHSARRRESRTRREKVKHNNNVNSRSNSFHVNKSNRSRSPIKKGKANIYEALNMDHPIDFGFNCFSSQFFHEPIETEMTVDLEKSKENLGMDYDLLAQQDPYPSTHQKPSATLLKKQDSSGSDVVDKKFQEEVKMDTAFDGKTQQDTLVLTLQSQQPCEAKAKESKRFDKEGEKLHVDDKKTKGDAALSLCSICEKKKRNV